MTKPNFSVILLLLAALLLIGCGDESAPITPPGDTGIGDTDDTAPSDGQDTDAQDTGDDVTDDNDVGPSTQEPDVPTDRPDRTIPSPDELEEHPDDGSIPLGGVCRRSGQCETEFCARIAAETNDGICTTLCSGREDTDCPAGWRCLLIASSGVDVEFVCVDPDFCIDRDGDGYGVGPGCDGPDCDDTDPEVYFGAPELCNGKDNSCNGIIDDRPIGVGEVCPVGDFGICDEGLTFCRFAELVCESVNSPQIEVCNGRDMNCDGEIDSGNPGGGQPCSTGLPGVCGTGQTQCLEAQVQCVATIQPGEQDEVCNGQDMNCDGTVDTGFDGLGEVCFAGEGVCARVGTRICNPSDNTAPTVCSATPGEPAQTESCNYQDDNCDGTVDGSFRDADGLYASVEHCGACDLNCNNFWPGGPELYNVEPTCAVQGGVAQCGFTCIDGYVDADGVAENGCELLPDDGAIYVSRPANGGSDSGDCGNWDAPCATIGFGVQRAEATSRARLRVSDGVFRERVALSNGISLLGGHNNANWTRNPDVFVSLISGSGGSGADRITITAADITSATTISGFTIQAENAGPGGNSIGIFIRNANEALVIENNQIFAGRGGNGVAGQAGTPGSNGNAGGAGNIRTTGASCGATFPLPGTAGTQTCPNLRAGGDVNVSGGGGGGATCPASGVRTGSGGNGNGASAGTGGTGPGHFVGTSSGCTVSPELGVDAVPGTPGTAGPDGTRGNRSGNAAGSIASGQWRGGNGGTGQAGLPGSGGGGGSAAAGVITSFSPSHYFGATGGGGGSGGCAGAAGTGGTAGGASFSIFISQDSNTASGQMPIIRNNVLNRGAGGDGGAGGNGGGGGDASLGGSGGLASASGGNRFDFCMFAGGDGGAGGRGGHGGGGAGGNGGASFDIFLHNGAARDAYTSNNTFSVGDEVGTGGSGGAGGNASNTAVGTGQGGSAGLSGRVGTL